MKILTFVSVVAYARNDENVAQFLIPLDRWLHQHFETHEIILVEDSGTDILEAALAVKDEVRGNVSVVTLQGRHGKDRALSAGTDLSIGDYIYELDTIPTSLQLELLMSMYSTAVDKGIDIILSGSIRLVTRRALYALENTKGLNRTERYKNCGFDWIQKACPEGIKWAWLDTILIRAGFFQGLLFTLAALCLLGGILLIQAAVLPGTMLMGFALVLLALAFLDGRIKKLSQDRLSYKVKDITRINRY